MVYTHGLHIGVHQKVLLIHLTLCMMISVWRWGYILILVTDECLSNNGGCSHSCWNTDGSFYCSCPSGYTMSSDNKTCASMYWCWIIWMICTFDDFNNQNHWFPYQYLSDFQKILSRCNLQWSLFCINSRPMRQSVYSTGGHWSASRMMLQ